MTTEKQFDVAIIGGGIQGAGIAVALAHAGFKVFLCEKDDFACGTSSASTKLIHGGLRYLEQAHFRLVRESLKERDVLMNIAPHLVTPLQFIMPVNESIRKKWILQLGFLFYDLLSGKSLIKKSRLLKRSQNHYFSELKNQFNYAFSYYDCWTSDTRLTIENILLAQKLGAVAVNYHECIDATVENDTWKLTIKPKSSNNVFSIRANCVINATGPWSPTVAKNLLKQNVVPKVKLIKGSHIIIKKAFSHDYAFILQHTDSRVIFVVPYEKDFQLIGTTDVKINELTELKVSEQEKNYLCDSFNQYFNSTIHPNDIVSCFSGVRILEDTDADKKPSELSRDYEIKVIQEANKAPIITIAGGKLTTYRIVSEKIARKLITLFPNYSFKSTKKLKLPGNQFEGLSFNAYLEKLKTKYAWLPSPLIERLVTTYGSRTELMLQNKHSLSDLGKHFGHGLYQAEVEFLIREEFVKHVDDILWRRTKLGLWFTDDQKKELELFL